MSDARTQDSESPRPLRLARLGAIWLIVAALPIAQVGSSRLATALLGGTMLLLGGGYLLAGQKWMGSFWRSWFNQLRDLWTGPHRLLAALAFGFVIWMIVSSAWSRVPLRGLQDVLVLTWTSFTCWVLVRELKPRNVVGRALILGSLCAAVLLVLEFANVTTLRSTFAAHPDHYYLNKNAAYLLLMACALPLPSGDKSGWRIPRWVAFGLIAIAIGFSPSQSTQLAVVSAAGVVVLLTWFPKLLPWIYRGLALVVLIFPALLWWFAEGLAGQIWTASNDVSFLQQGNAAHRVALWEGYGGSILQKPLFGWGNGASFDLGMSGPAAKIAESMGFPPQATSPHNFVLEIWTNFGAVGALLIAAIFWRLPSLLAKLNGRAMRSVTAIVVATYSISFLQGSVFQAWWVSSIAIALAIALVLGSDSSGERGQQ